MIALSLGALALALHAPSHVPAPDPPGRAVDAERLMATVRWLPASRSAAGDERSRANLLALQTDLAARAVELGYWPTAHPVRWKRRTEATGLDWRNISFEIPGRTAPQEVLIVGAHFDAVPGSPGADDNGSGTAGLLEMARVLRDRPMHRTVRFVLFNLEELGHTGSNQYVAQVRGSHLDGSQRIVGMLSLEMLGYYSSEPGSQRNPFRNVAGAPQRDTGDFLALATIAAHGPFCRALEAAMRTDLPDFAAVSIDMFPIAPPDLLRSDHAPFLLLGVPAVMVTDTANFRNPHYHKATDTPDTLDAAGFARAVRALADAVHALAGPLDAGPPPTWNEPAKKQEPAEDAPRAPGS
ncbi:MAG: M28 family peptidase [Phycisphaerae bacterium]|nr:M28 family peptidase [Phycisphaerae bacterium]